MIQHIDVQAVLQQSAARPYTDLVTRPTGRVVREEIERAMARVEARLAVMDFTRVGCIDYSCADEIVAKLLRGGAAVLLLRGISEGHREAIEPVLRGHGLAVVWERADGALDALGDPGAGRGLLEALVAQRLAARTPRGTIALVLA